MCFYIGYLLTFSAIGIFFTIFCVILGSYLCSEALNIIPSVKKSGHVTTWNVLRAFAVIFFSGCIIYFPYSLHFAGYYITSIVTIGLYLITIVIVVVSYLVIYKSKYFKLKIVFRFLFFGLITALCIILGITSTGTFIDQWIHNGFSNAIKNWSLNSPGKLIEVLTFFILPQFIESIFLLSYSLKNNVVVLRSFKYDDDDDYKSIMATLSKVCSRKNMNVMYIGNPNRFFNFIPDCKSYYLPTVDWQREVSVLISKAKIVFCYLGVSDGILWELLNHDRDWHKFIFFIGNNGLCDNLRDMLSSIKNTKQKQILEYCIEGIVYHVGNKGMCFMIIGTQCYYSENIVDCIKYLISGDGVDSIKTFSIDIRDSVENLSV